MELRDMIIILDRVGQNNGRYSRMVGAVADFPREEEAIRLAMELVNALSQAGAKTTAEALSLLRIYPMISERDKDLERHAAELRRMIGLLEEKEQVQRLLLKAALAVADMPCGSAKESASTGHPGGLVVRMESGTTIPVGQMANKEV